MVQYKRGNDFFPFENRVYCLFLAGEAEFDSEILRERQACLAVVQVILTCRMVWKRGASKFFPPIFQAASAQNEDDFCPSSRRCIGALSNLRFSSGSLRNRALKCKMAKRKKLGRSARPNPSSRTDVLHSAYPAPMSQD